MLSAVRHVGFVDIVDALCSQFELYNDTRSETERRKNIKGRDSWYSFESLDETKEMFKGDRVGRLLSTVIRHPFFRVKKNLDDLMSYRPLCEATIELSTHILRQETSTLNSILRKAMDTYTFADVVGFSVERELIRPIKTELPFLYRLLLSVFARDEWISDYGDDPWAGENDWTPTVFASNKERKAHRRASMVGGHLNRRFLICSAISILAYVFLTSDGNLDWNI